MDIIDTNKLELGTPEYEAALTINVSIDCLANLDEYAFECWLKESFNRDEIRLGGNTLKVPETEKKAILHFIAFWYYRSNK